MTTLRTGLTGVALLVLLAACGTEEAPADEIASLSTAPPAATATASASPAASERPLLRPDTTQEEEDRLYDVYFACMGKYGSPRHAPTSGDAAEPAPAPADPEYEKAMEAAQKACEHLEPEKPWQRAQRTDPEYADKLRDWITCIRSHGIEAWESDGFVAFESLPPDDKLKLVDECEVKAFAVS
ncbi:hypothetical protein [Catenuloplanes atrovinosus]|uniref:Secreted protein n=1 Tax=Catenuloplanes atrovinosus TaxID=137266 RepID=A0AAE3YVQ7_9ACTN|nr:hypothetical protein [Catenuloplanes atrovinosus]MDR7279234.1 hypothetical protein [Catenuloplanes atrovinosus]